MQDKMLEEKEKNQPMTFEFKEKKMKERENAYQRQTYTNLISKSQ